MAKQHAKDYTEYRKKDYYHIVLLLQYIFNIMRVYNMWYWLTPNLHVIGIHYSS